MYYLIPSHHEDFRWAVVRSTDARVVSRWHTWREARDEADRLNGREGK